MLSQRAILTSPIISINISPKFYPKSHPTFHSVIQKLQEDIFVAAARKELEYMIKTIYLKIVYSALHRVFILLQHAMITV